MDDVLFTTEVSISRTDEIIAYMLGPRLWIPQLDYPDFDRWAAKAHEQLKGEQKRAIVAIVRQQIVGVAIYQQHLTDPNALEIKNLTVRPDQRGRHIASFLLRNAELEGAQDFKASHVLVDAKVGNLAIRSFLHGHHYSAQAIVDLYRLNAGQDVVYRKPLVSIHV